MSGFQDRTNPGNRAQPRVTTAQYANDPGWIAPDDLYHRAGHAAKLFCILAAGLIPNLLILSVLL